MMDPGSLAFGIAGVATLAAKLVECLCDIKDGGKQRIRLTAEISALWLVLENVKTQIEEVSINHNHAPLTHLTALGNRGGPLEQCSTILKQLLDKCAPKAGTRAILQNLRWTLDKDEVIRYLEVVHRLQAAINLAYAQTSMSLLNSLASNTAAACELLKHQEVKNMLLWLSPIDFEAQQRQVFSKWCPGTITWFLDHKHYRAWKAGLNPYLWCPSNPGSGKTTLTSVVINSLKESRSLPTPYAVLGIYLSAVATQPDDQRVCQLIGSLVKQLCHSLQTPDPIMLDYYRQMSSTSNPPQLEELLEHLNRLISPYPRTFIVIDAVDELYSQSERILLFACLKKLKNTVSIMVLSRPNRIIRNLFAPLHGCCKICSSTDIRQLYHCPSHPNGGYSVCVLCYGLGHTKCSSSSHAPLKILQNCLMLQFSAYPEDIQQYARARLDQDDHYQNILDGRASLKKEIVDKAVSIAGTTFLSARLFFEFLQTLETVRSIRQSLEKPFDYLKGTCEQAMADLQKQRPIQVQLARETLKWVICAKRPLRCAELEQAVRVGDDIQEFDLDDIVPAHKLVEYCAGLVTVDYEDRVSFVHHRADEFLAPIVANWYPNCHAEISSSCLNFLLLDTIERERTKSRHGIVERLLSEYPFIQYAAKFWAVHLRQSGPDTNILLALRFLTSEDHLYIANALNSVAVTGDSDVLSGLSALHMAAIHGLPKLLLRLIAGGHCKNVDIQDKLGWTALRMATTANSAASVRILLDYGAEPNLADNNGVTPLFRAISDERLEIVEHLIMNKFSPADVNLHVPASTFFPEDITPLIFAVKKGNGEVVRALLHRSDLMVDAEVSGHNPLTLCAWEGKIDCLRLLLKDKRCDVNRKNSQGYTALHLAALCGHDDALRELISSGSRIEEPDRDGRTALLICAGHSHSDAMWQLLKSNSKLAAIDSHGRNVLHHAAGVENDIAMQLLLDQKGVASLLDKKDDLGDTPLHKAILHDQRQNAKLLVCAGARTDIQNDGRLTSYQLSSERAIDLTVAGESK